MDGPLRVAGIDVGSNALRLLVVESDGGDVHVLLNKRAPVRLGHHAFTQGHLGPDAVDAAVAALREFRDELDRLGVHEVRAVATSAVRESDDAGDFVRRVRREAGIRLEVIDGAEEARLVHRAVRERIPLGDEPWMLMDLGGGSLEIALVDRDRIHWSESRRIGTVRLLEMPPDDIHGHVDGFQLLHNARALPIAGLVATGGNSNALVALTGHEPRTDGTAVLELKRLAGLRAQLERMSPAQRRERHGLKPDRADVIVPAALVYERVARLAGVDRLHVPGLGLRDGVVLDLLDARLRPEQRLGGQALTVEQSALRLGRAIGFDEAHGTHVARLSLKLFDDLRGLHGLGDRHRRVLQAAALLHDVGRVLSAERHHKHSQYLIENAELAGLGEHDTHLAGLVARYHRRSLPQDHHRTYRMLGRRDRRRVHVLGGILRLADGLDAGHDRCVAEVEVEWDERGLRVKVEAAGTTGADPVTLPPDKVDLLELALGRTVTIQEEAWLERRVA